MRKNKYATIADFDANAVANEHLKVSYEYIDWDSEEFFFHGMEISFYQKFFDCISTIEKSLEKEITEQTHHRLSPKSIFNKDTGIRLSFPNSVIETIKDKLFVQTRNADAAQKQASEITSRAFEVRITKGAGRLHGFIWNNIFYLVWIDPAHNLYPGKGTVTKHRNKATVKCFSPDEVMRLKGIIKALQEENSQLYDAL